MKIIVNRSVEVEVKTIRINITVFHKDISVNFPLSKKVSPYSRRVCIDIDIETGVIKKWPQGRNGEIKAKIVDEGCYYLLDENNEEVAFIERGYVPNKIIPPKDGYSDYIHLIVDTNGKITNWYEDPDISEFEEYYDDDDDSDNDNDDGDN